MGVALLVLGIVLFLPAAGRDATVVELPGDGTGDLDASADVLETAAQAALARTGATSADVVGYSARGIVTRLWIADGGADVTRRVVTLGSPNHGTSLADLAGNLPIDACPAACRQLATDNDVMRRLNAGDETPDGPTWVSIWRHRTRPSPRPTPRAWTGRSTFEIPGRCLPKRPKCGRIGVTFVADSRVLCGSCVHNIETAEEQQLS